MDKMTLDEVVEELRAAGEITRARVLALLKDGELSVGELAQILAQSQPRLSRHMKFLTSAGLVERLPEGAWVFYRLATRGPQRIFVDALLAQMDPNDPILRSDRARLFEIRKARQVEATSFFEQAATEWEAIRSLHYPEKDIENAVLRHAGEGPFTRVVDLGTGTGRMLSLLAPLTETAEGIDLSHQMLTVARSNLSQTALNHVSVRHGDATRTPFEDASADLVIIHQVLHFLDDPMRAIQESARILKPNGKLIIVDFAPHDLEYLRREQAHRHLGFDVSYFDEWCRASALKTEKCETFDPPDNTCQGLAVTVYTATKPLDQEIANSGESLEGIGS